MLRGIESIGSRIFWSAIWIAVVLGVLYVSTGFVKRHFAGTLPGNVAQGVEDFTQPH